MWKDRQGLEKQVTSCIVEGQRKGVCTWHVITNVKNWYGVELVKLSRSTTVKTGRK